MAKNTNYLFPDTEKVGGIIFHYNKRVNGSFVQAAKRDLNVVVEKLKRYRGVNLKQASEVSETHIYIYPDIKSFRKSMGYEIQKMETRQMHHMASKGIETRYILYGEDGSVHMVLPQGRGVAVYNTFSSELISMVVTQYIDMDQKGQYELKNTVKRYIKSEREREEQEKQRKLQEEEEEQQKEIQEQEEQQRLEEEEEQKRLEELEEEELKQALLELNEVDEEEQEQINETQQEVEQLPETPAWLIYGWRAYVCNRLQSASNRKKFSYLLDKFKMTKPTSLKGDNKVSEYDLDVAAATVEYIISVYGYKSYVKFCESPDNIKGIFYKGTTWSNAKAKEKFNSEVKAYISQKYKTSPISEMVEIKDEEVVNIVEAKKPEENPIQQKVLDAVDN